MKTSQLSSFYPIFFVVLALLSRIEATYWDRSKSAFVVPFHRTAFSWTLGGKQDRVLFTQGNFRNQIRNTFSNEKENQGKDHLLGTRYGRKNVLSSLHSDPYIFSVSASSTHVATTLAPSFIKVESLRNIFLLQPFLFSFSSSLHFVPALLINSVLGTLGYFSSQKSLTKAGLLHAFFLGGLLWTVYSWQGWSTCVLYLIAGSLVTKVKMEEKEKLGIAEKRGGARGPENVWGSAAAGTLCVLLSLFAPSSMLIPLQIGYVSSLSTKLSDTFASEIGKAFGKRTFLITTFKPVPPGTEGAVSLEGTLAGIVGSIIISLWGIFVGLVPAKLSCFTLLLFAAFLATNIESFLGASLQNKEYEWATNEFINFLNTLIGAIIGVVGAYLIL